MYRGSFTADRHVRLLRARVDPASVRPSSREGSAEKPADGGSLYDLSIGAQSNLAIEAG